MRIYISDSDPCFLGAKAFTRTFIKNCNCIRFKYIWVSFVILIPLNSYWSLLRDQFSWKYILLLWGPQTRFNVLSYWLPIINLEQIHDKYAMDLNKFLLEMALNMISKMLPLPTKYEIGHSIEYLGFVYNCLILYSIKCQCHLYTMPKLST